MSWYRRLPSQTTSVVIRMVGSDAAAGIVLVLVAIGAMLVANSPLAYDYHALFRGPLGWTPIAKLETLHLWINDALMAIFFFVVGLEIKRELVIGELSTAAKRRLPVLAAIAGMVFPAIVYVSLAGGDAVIRRGWAIPAATDIAFALGVIGLLGKRVPPSLRLFLLSVAIVDDLGAVAIIALVYTSGIEPGWLIAALVVLAGMIALNRSRSDRLWPYPLLAIALWYCILHSGVHPTIAGAIAALMIPLRPDPQGSNALERLEHALSPWNSFFIVPLFGFANAGVSLAGVGIEELFAPLPLAVMAGLVIGKQAGIVAAVALSERTGFAPRPEGVSWMQIWGMAVLCGIGFTMSLFIAALAFPLQPALFEQSKLGVLSASVLSAMLGFAILLRAPRHKS